MTSGTDYREVFERAPDGVLITGPGGRIVEANAMAERLLGYPEGGLEGVSVDDLVPEGSRSRHAAHRAAYAEDPHPRPMGIGMELAARRRDGSEFPVEISLSPMREGRSDHLIVTLRDVADRRRLRDFGAEALRAAEEERLRIARELHDDTAQALAAILLRLRIIAREGVDAPMEERLEDLRHDVSGVAEGVRRIARGLRPPAIEDAGLVAALESLIRGIREDHGVRVRLECEAHDPSVDPGRRLVVYRIVQEALANVVRHAETDVASVHLAHGDGTIAVEIRDEGRGFSTAEAAERTWGSGHLGLLGMRERALGVSGSLEIESAPGEGTTVRAVVPVDRSSGERNG